MTTAGITATGTYIPMTRLPVGKTGERAVAAPDEDCVTMAVAASVECLFGIDRATIDGVIFASTSYPYKEKLGPALMARALDLPRDIMTADLGGSLRAGIDALLQANDAVCAGSHRNVLVVASDARMGAPR